MGGHDSGGKLYAGIVRCVLDPDARVDCAITFHRSQLNRLRPSTNSFAASGAQTLTGLDAIWLLLKKFCGICTLFKGKDNSLDEAERPFAREMILSKSDSSGQGVKRIWVRCSTPGQQLSHMVAITLEIRVAYLGN